MTYNRKQMKPLIDKYQINPETNKLFANIIELFDGQPNYQIWGVKMIFSQSMSYNDLVFIGNWALENKNLISQLEKKNVVSYSTKSAISKLKLEIEGLKKVNFIKDIVSRFNTDQRKILTKTIFSKELTPSESFLDSTISMWYDILVDFNKKPMARKLKFYSTCSAVRDANKLFSLINDCLQEDYEWDKEDMLSFLSHNAKDCDVVFDKGNVVIVRVPSYESSHKLCGNGRTGWCLSRESDYFDRYVTSYGGKRSQFFLFDFGRNETDCFAHIGFTIESGRGIVEAQTCDNNPMMSDWQQGKEKLNIHKVLEMNGVKLSQLVVLPKKLNGRWDLGLFLNYLKSYSNRFKITYQENNRIMVLLESNDLLSYATADTFIDRNNCRFGDDYKNYLFIDFNLRYNDDNSMILMSYSKDEYGSLSIINSQNVYGKENTNVEKYINGLGVNLDKCLDRKPIEASLLLHKLINEGKEDEAINLIDKEGDNFDINFEFNFRRPIFGTVDKGMILLFDKIVKHPKYDSNTSDGFGEPIFQSLIYLLGNEEVDLTSSERTMLEKMIRSVLDSKYYNFNVCDINNDAAINNACEYPSLTWVVEELVKNKDVDINHVDCFDLSPLSTCIKNNNIEALKLIGMRPDLEVTPSDKKNANKLSINLDDYIKPNNSILELEFSKSIN